MADIKSQVRTVRELLAQGFRLGAYQRDYEWERDQVLALFQDLKSSFVARVGKRGAGEYFLGPIVVKDDNPPWLVDGQQRLTTLALFIAAIRNCSRDPDLFGALNADQELEQGARKSKGSAMGRLRDPIFKHPKMGGSELPTFFGDHIRQNQIVELDVKAHLPPDGDDSARRVEEAFKLLQAKIIETYEPADLTNLLEWVNDQVVLVEIKTGKSHNDFTIFDTMNSRGRPLDPLSQFLAFIGRGIPDQAIRIAAQNKFKEVQSNLTRLGKRQDIEFVKSWLAARCLELPDPTPERGDIAREKLNRSLMGKIDPQNVRFAIDNADHIQALGLDNRSQFIEQHWSIYGAEYVKIRNAYETYDSNLESLWFLAQTKFESFLDLYDEVLMLAALPPGSKASNGRLKITGQFLENIAARVAWLRVCPDSTPRALNRDRIKYLVARAASLVRGRRSLNELAETLSHLQETELGLSFDQGRNPRLIPSNKFLIRALLARMTWYLDSLNRTPQQSGTQFADYLSARGSQRFEIEHLLPAPFSREAGQGHTYRSADNYRRDRDRVGALVILRSSINRSMSDRTYALKLIHYANNEQNALQMTLRGHETLSTQLRSGLVPSGANFPDASTISRTVIEAREKAMRQVAEYQWGPARLREMGRELESHG